MNLMVIVFATIGLEIGLTRLGLSFGKLFPDLNQLTVTLCDHLLLTTFFSFMGITLLYLGSRKLSRIE
jgi:hypothetical protein